VGIVMDGWVMERGKVCDAYQYTNCEWTDLLAEGLAEGGAVAVEVQGQRGQACVCVCVCMCVMERREP
jgi:hypothetical protein